MLAVEVFQKANSRGTRCDLVTGEERRYGRSDGEPSNHSMIVMILLSRWGKLGLFVPGLATRR